MTHSIGPGMLNTQQLYGGAPHPVESSGGLLQEAVSSASHLHTSVPQSYSAMSSHYISSTSSSVASQGFPLSSGHYAMPSVSSAVYPHLSYPAMSIGSPYRQVLTSQSLPAVGQFKETNAFPGQSTIVPRTLQQQVTLGYNSTSWSTSDFQSAQENLSRNHTGSVAKASNQINTVGIVDSSHPVNQNVQFTKPGVETSVSSVVTSSVRTPAADHLIEPASVPSSTQPPESLLQEAIDSSSTTSSASPVTNNYDALEGGGYPETDSATSSPAPPPQISRNTKPFGYGYPTLQPGYQNATLPTSAMQPSNPGHQSGFQQYPQQYPGVNQLSSSLGGLSLQHSQQPESLRPVNLIQERNILPVSPVLAPVPNLNSDLRKLNCNPDSFRCTLTNIPQTQALLNKAKLPLGYP
uniref:Uncharacterized protein n=1 Tax=Pelodiscus sinensis TaxID=13735 RepID=K7F5B5_PELSI